MAYLKNKVPNARNIENRKTSGTYIFESVQAGPLRTPQTSKHSALFQTIDLNSFARSQETLNTHQRDRQDHIN